MVSAEDLRREYNIDVEHFKGNVLEWTAAVKMESRIGKHVRIEVFVSCVTGEVKHTCQPPNWARSLPEYVAALHEVISDWAELHNDTDAQDDDAY